MPEKIKAKRYYFLKGQKISSKKALKFILGRRKERVNSGKIVAMVESAFDVVNDHINPNDPVLKKVLSDMGLKLHQTFIVMMVPKLNERIVAASQDEMTIIYPLQGS